MNREEAFQQLLQQKEWDITIIGGGATGLGAALDAKSRGYATLLVEQYDFGKGTSSRSTKLVHGGVRYLEKGNIKLVREALRERAYLLKNAPHLTSVQPFVIPVFTWWKKYYYGIGLKIYDLLSGKFSLGKTSLLSKVQTGKLLPTVKQEKLAGGILYYDGQFNDSNLCTDLATTAAGMGACMLNYTSATGFIKHKKKITGIQIKDNLSGKEFTIRSKAVINATGVFTDKVMDMDDPEKEPMITPSQGIHLVVDAHFFPGAQAMMIPKTDDGRVLFAVPWQNKVIIGTTDTPVLLPEIEPIPLEEEIIFILAHINRYTIGDIGRKDVKAVFAGLRPLVKTKGTPKTALLSRDHTLVISPTGLVTITGGKWTTYRKMAEDAIDNAVFISKLEKRPCVTSNLSIGNPLQKRKNIDLLVAQYPDLSERIHANYPYLKAEIVYAIRHEMALTVEDILARRTRLLFLDAAAAIEVADLVARIMSKELLRDDLWIQYQVNEFKSLAQQYLLP